MKVHLLDVPEPVTIGGKMKANCGKELESASLAFMWDEQAMNHSLEFNALQMCRKCMNLEFDHRYIYGLVQGELEP